MPARCASAQPPALSVNCTCFDSLSAISASIAPGSPTSASAVTVLLRTALALDQHVAERRQRMARIRAQRRFEQRAGAHRRHRKLKSNQIIANPSLRDLVARGGFRFNRARRYFVAGS